jgi:hypothetical protein
LNWRNLSLLPHIIKTDKFKTQKQHYEKLLSLKKKIKLYDFCVFYTIGILKSDSSVCLSFRWTLIWSYACVRTSYFWSLLWTAISHRRLTWIVAVNNQQELNELLKSILKNEDIRLCAALLYKLDLGALKWLWVNSFNCCGFIQMDCNKCYSQLFTNK